MPGGQSNPTYRVDMAGLSCVLRRKPSGPLLPSAHAIEREYEVMSRLYGSDYPSPRPYALCEDTTVIGAPFYVMQMVQGRTEPNGSLPEMTPTMRREHYHAMIDTLARLHAVDYVAAGLASFGKPQNFYARQIDRWTRQYRIAQLVVDERMERLIEWLPRSKPAQTTTTIIHGDYRIDNLIFASLSARVEAVIDWELSTLGDPLADLSYFLTSWFVEPAQAECATGPTGPATGIPTFSEAVDRYCRVARRDDIPNLDWYLAYNFFRSAAIVQGIAKRMLDGNASGAEPGRVVARFDSLAETALNFAVRSGA